MHIRNYAIVISKFCCHMCHGFWIIKYRIIVFVCTHHSPPPKVEVTLSAVPIQLAIIIQVEAVVTYPC